MLIFIILYLHVVRLRSVEPPRTAHRQKGQTPRPCSLKPRTPAAAGPNPLSVFQEMHPKTRITVTGGIPNVHGQVCYVASFTVSLITFNEF